MKINPSKAKKKKLKEALESIPYHRKARGLRHSQATIAACAVISGSKSFLAIGEWSNKCTQNILKKLGCYFNREKQCYIRH